MRKRKPRIDLTGFENKHGVVVGTDKPGKWYIKCCHCGDTHEQSSRDIQNGCHARDCKYQKPHNYTGLEREDVIIRNQYGITLAAYYQMLANQGGGCAICGRIEEPDGRRLSVDHCHSTGKVRGVLCFACNKGLGLFYDNTDWLRKAVNYLEGDKQCG